MPELEGASRARTAAFDPAVAEAISQLVSEFFLRTDRPEFGSVAELFHDEGALTLGSLCVQGREAIATFFETRNAEQRASGRKTRHISGPLSLRPLPNGWIEAHAPVTVFTGFGEPPFPSGPPSTIVDFDDVCAPCGDGGWRFVSRKATVIFTGESAPSFAK